MSRLVDDCLEKSKDLSQKDETFGYQIEWVMRMSYL